MKSMAITTVSATVYLLMRFALLKYTDGDYWKAFFVSLLGFFLVWFMVKEWLKDLKAYNDNQFYNNYTKRPRRNREN